MVVCIKKRSSVHNYVAKNLLNGVSTDYNLTDFKLHEFCNFRYLLRKLNSLPLSLQEAHNQRPFLPPERNGVKGAFSRLICFCVMVYVIKSPYQCTNALN